MKRFNLQNKYFADWTNYTDNTEAEIYEIINTPMPIWVRNESNKTLNHPNWLINQPFELCSANWANDHG